MKERLDVLLVNNGLAPSREQAKALIMEGKVYVNGGISDKPGMSVDTEAEVVVKGSLCPYVSRGGLKLEKAIQAFDIDLDDAVCLDIGASTGGFTDCMLQHGARKVYAVDVGYGQLAWKLREDSRVVNIEKCNFRYLNLELVPEPIDFASADVSFISLSMIFPVAAKLIAEGGSMVALIKPQFEAGREQVGKNGIVRDASVHVEVIKRVAEFAEADGLHFANLDFSPITGAKGNIEYLMHLNKSGAMEYNEGCEKIEETVKAAHSQFI